MKVYQKITVLISVITMFLMVLFPPFHAEVKSIDTSMGYRWLFSRPKWDANTYATIDSSALLEQVAVVIGVCGLLLLSIGIFGKKAGDSGNIRVQERKEPLNDIQTGLVKITCPNCEHERKVPFEKIPVKALNATCPKCSQRFTFRKGDT